KAYLDRRGMEPIRWHALRRVIAAVLQDQGVPLERIRDLMGHSQLRVTESYAYTIPETLQKDMDAVDDALGPSGDETHSAPDSPAD
ncbi:MAG: tyrosine-type recombinase/integrase, partial [Anaerolineae bacterium]